MNDENNQGLVKAVDRLTQQIKKSTQIITGVVVFFTGVYLSKITPPSDILGIAQNITFLIGGFILFITSIY
ncbi:MULTISPECIES: hypothetical protein [unclassified Nostoc]|uniref:hypothetical protein n=1 Tax=unclassified Nostoc TaxID=2593658 RepID=UPI002AD48C5C|nr:MULTISPECIES: hypothetical protein [unclassified Nostoc]MDZ7989918.1 hypothetical protein [Nostoc sp. DedVER02]MDZ8112020.1 hypothetical protein [Nostoc sp. DedVER01b]